MSKQRLLYIVSQVNKSLAFEWVAKGLKDHYDLSFVLLNADNSLLEDFLRKEGIPVKRIKYRGKRDFPLALLQTFFHLLFKRPSIMHVHLLDAQLIGLTASALLGIKKRIYTRHNSNFHHVYHKSGLKYDRWSNALATKIISISQATDYVLLNLDKVPADKILKIPHGFDWHEFTNVTEERIDGIRNKWQIPTGGKIVGVIARHIEWKGIQFILPAFHEFVKRYPDAKIVLANAAGPYHSTIIQMTHQLPKETVIMIPFEEDVAALYRTFHLFVHTPVDSICEAFGQTYVEALALEVPSVFSLSGIAAEFIVDRKNALTVPFKDSGSIYTAMVDLLEDKQLRQMIAENGKQEVVSRFAIEPMLSSLRRLYDE